MNKVHRKRLSNVAKACREMKEPKKFTMEHWGYRNSCGTPACAMGNYAFRRDLQRTFKLSKHGNVVGNDGHDTSFFDYIGSHYFGIISGEVVELFGSGGCNEAQTHIEAAKYIENFVSTH